MEDPVPPPEQWGLDSNNQAAAQPDAQELTGSQQVGMTMGTGQGKTQQEQQEEDGKEREDMGKDNAKHQGRSLPRRLCQLGAPTGLGSSWELARGRRKTNQPRHPAASICPVSVLTSSAWQKSYDEASALQGHENR